MKIADIDKRPSLPGILFYQPPCLLDFPFNVEISDAWSKTGSGVGNELSSLQTALGEYFERRHFYMEVFPEKHSKLSRVMSNMEQRNFSKAFIQTTDRPLSIKELECHEFGLSKAYRVSDFSQCYIPTIAISLSFDGNKNDNFIYPCRDTCGCSFHWSPQQAVFGAVKESLERQFLTKFWLTKECTKALDSSEINEVLKNSGAYSLYKVLDRSGDLFVLDISDDRFPGKCLIVIYGNESEIRNIHYCTGMSYAESLSVALEKSIFELWQTYRFMSLHAAISTTKTKISDPYLKHFLSCNSYETFREMSTYKKTNNRNGANANSCELNLPNLLKTLENIGIEGYIYTKSIEMCDMDFTFCKFISPSLFMHMNNSRNINTRNDYSASFLSRICPSRKQSMVPFP